ncbi:MAG: hypothetical protein HKL92_07965 [Candidatus Eremiobacteraeota bacterium]|nr:hypothetical protein [Candidatus Eremiobacteraeota bacterium]NNM93262.1 hypothetical protein [Candidatus Eremiobacteraeota bacterium]
MSVADIVGATALLIADLVLIASKDPRVSWLKTTARVQGVSLALGLASGAVFNNPRFVEYGFIGVALSAIPFFIAYLQRRKSTM